MIYTNPNGFFEVFYWIYKYTIVILIIGIKSTFGMIKNVFTSPKKTKRDKIPQKPTQETSNSIISSATTSSSSKDFSSNKGHIETSEFYLFFPICVKVFVYIVNYFKAKLLAKK